MKKSCRFLAILLCAVMLFAIVACNKDSTTEPSTSGDAPGTSSNQGGSSPAGSPGSSPAGSPGGSSSGGSSADHDTINIAVTGDYGTLAHENLGGDFYMAMMCVMEPMWDVDDEDNTIWILANSVDELTDTHWQIHLKEGIKFSNGSDLKANDVVFTLGVEKAGSNGVPRTQLMDLDQIKALDDYTVDFYWTKYHIEQYRILSDLCLYDEETYDALEATTAPIGTGPYKVAEYVVNSHLFLERRDDYWGEPAVFKNIRCRVLTEASQIVNALETGMIDVAKIPLPDYDYVSSFSDFNMVDLTDSNYVDMQFNLYPTSLIHDPEARMAIIHAIDRQALLNIVYGGHGYLLNRPVPNYVIDDEPRFDNIHPIYSVGYDPTLAKQYAESTGLVGQTLRLITAGQPEFVAMAEMVLSMLGEIGITVQINNYDVATFRDISRDQTQWEFSLISGFNPGLKTAPTIVMGMTPSFPNMNTPEHWAGQVECEAIAINWFQTKDPVERGNMTYRMLELWENEAVRYAFFQYTAAYSVAKFISPVFQRRLNGGIRFLSFELA